MQANAHVNPHQASGAQGEAGAVLQLLRHGLIFSLQTWRKEHQLRPSYGPAQRYFFIASFLYGDIYENLIELLAYKFVKAHV